MIEIQLGEEFDVPSVFFSEDGRIILQFPLEMKIDEALSKCEEEMIRGLRIAFSKLFGDREVARDYDVKDRHVSIRPQNEQWLLDT